MKNKLNLFTSKQEGFFLSGALLAWVVFQTVIAHTFWPNSFLNLFLLEAAKTFLLSSIIFRTERKIFNHWATCPFSKIIFFRIVTYTGLAIAAALLLLLAAGSISLKSVFVESLGNILFLFATALALDAVRLIGRFPIEKLVLGKYHQPKEEERIFLFIDLKESTKLSLELGTQNFSYLVKEFFKDVDWAAQKWKGEIYQYAGDQVIISWLVKDKSTFSAAMNTYVSFYQRMREKRTYYREQFGAAPSFKAAIHEGKVITTWVGHSKREIVYQGDVLNITARLTDLAKNLSYPIVVSEAVASQLAFQFREHIIFGGDYTVKGVDNPIPVYFFVFKKPATEKVEKEETSLVLA